VYSSSSRLPGNDLEPVSFDRCIEGLMELCGALRSNVTMSRLLITLSRQWNAKGLAALCRALRTNETFMTMEIQLCERVGCNGFCAGGDEENGRGSCGYVKS
jgi:hypothetical protein